MRITAKCLRSAVFKTHYATIGISNCFDGEFPESVRQMRLDGAELLLWCNASCGNSKLGWSGRIHLSGGHAQANFFWVVCCNCVSENTTGTSCIMSPNGEPLVVLPPNEEALGTCRIDLAMSANWDGVAMSANWDLWRTRLCRNVRRNFI